jgi:TPP-dependent pyruvate/acetoin dehydrogenase alpha subunit
MRMLGHAQHDDARYVPKEKFEDWKTRDPIERYQKKLLEEKVITEKQLGEMTEEIRTLCEADAEYALEAAMPEGPEALEGVYSREVNA